jgi:hypothetical protein
MGCRILLRAVSCQRTSSANSKGVYRKKLIGDTRQDCKRRQISKDSLLIVRTFEGGLGQRLESECYEIQKPDSDAPNSSQYPLEIKRWIRRRGMGGMGGIKDSILTSSDSSLKHVERTLTEYNNLYGFSIGKTSCSVRFSDFTS